MPMPSMPRGARRRSARPPARRVALRLERAPVDRVLVHDPAGHGSLPLALVLVPRLARRPVGARAGRLARRRQRGPTRAAGRRLRRHGRRLGRLLLREPAHLVRVARAAGARSSAPSTTGWTRRPGRSQELAHRRDRRGAEARAGARRDDDGREGPRLHLAGRRTRTPTSRASARRWRARPRATAPPTPRARAPGLRYTAFDRHASPRPTDGRAPPGVAAGARGVPGRRSSRSTRPSSSCAASGRCSTRSPGATCATRCTPRSRCPPVPAYSDFVDRAASGTGGPGDRVHASSSPPRPAATCSPSRSRRSST